MKKSILCTVIAALAISATVYAQSSDVYVNGVKTQTPVSAQVKSNITYVPIRVIAEGIGADVEWNNNKIILTKGETTITFIPGIWKAYINGDEKGIASPVYISNGTAFAGSDDLAKVLDCKIEYNDENKSFNVTFRDTSTITAEDVVGEAPEIKFENQEQKMEIVAYPTYWNGKSVEHVSAYRAVWNNKDIVLANQYNAQVNEAFKFNFAGIAPDSVRVRMEYLEPYQEEEKGFYPQDVSVTKTGDFYEFVHMPVDTANENSGSRIYVIDAVWGGSSFKYVFVVDNTNAIVAYEGLDTLMESRKAVDYCIIGNWVYYAAIEGNKGIHKALIDGTSDIMVASYPRNEVINDNTKITSEYNSGAITYQFGVIVNYDDDSEYSVQDLGNYYELNINDNTWTEVDVLK